MKNLREILYKVSIISTIGTMDREIAGIAFDSRDVKNNFLFIAVKGTQVDGHLYINTAIEKGAIAILCQEIPENLKADITYIKVIDSNSSLGILASNFYDNPSTKIKLVGVTGTNGKTTTVTLLQRLFIALGYRCGLLSTVENRINEEVIPSTHTTPDAIRLNSLLHTMVSRGCEFCFMEVSSHAIVQHRIAGLHFAGALFTNITHDHLDYHRTFDEYIAAKKMFFDGLASSAFALVNADDKRGLIMLQNTKASKNTFALKTAATFKARMKSNTFQGLELEIENKDVWFKQIGSFNAYNLLGVFGTAVLLGEDKDEILTQLSDIESAKGRFEQIISGSLITGIIDYAHTPDALKNVLETIVDLRNGTEKIITVIGCGGNRDAAKRPVMADIASKLSDKVILTSDNPRDEDPFIILKQMEEGVSVTNKKKVVTISDRNEAIKTACLLAEPKDIILVAGKGHESYQEIKGVKYPFDDKSVLDNIFKMMNK